MQLDDDHPELIEARRLGYPYLVYRDAGGTQQVLSLPDDWKQVTMGRGAGADVILSWDEGVSGVHATLERLADAWIVVDDGLSSNGTFVNGERVDRRQRLNHGDEMRLGETEILFHAPLELDRGETQVLRIDDPPS
jgi:pSer/pThr/pTyr-binding forkhead associated (FHA) protein